MFGNVDELLICRPYIGIRALVVGRVLSLNFLLCYIYIHISTYTPLILSDRL